VTSEVTSSRNLSSTPFISGTRKATNFKFGRYIHSVYPTKRLLKIWEKRERECIQGRPKFFQYPLLSQERVELRTSNLTRILTGPFKNFGEKGALAYPGAAEIFSVPPIIYEVQVWQVYSQGPCEPTTLKNLGEKGVSRGCRNFFSTPFKFGMYIQSVHANKSPLNLEVKGALAYPGSAKICEQSH